VKGEDDSSVVVNAKLGQFRREEGENGPRREKTQPAGTQLHGSGTHNDNWELLEHENNRKGAKRTKGGRIHGREKK